MFFANFGTKHLQVFKSLCGHGCSGRRSLGFLNLRITLLLRLPKVILTLHAKPDFGAVTDPLADTKCHFSRDGGAAIDHTRQGDARHAQLLCCFVHAEPQFGQNIIANDEAGVGGVVHGHGYQAIKNDLLTAVQAQPG